MSDVVNAVVLGLVEGVTEFLPISSTGHMIIVGDVLGFTNAFSKVFEVVIQLGAILAVCWLYRTKILVTLQGLGRPGESRDFARNVLIAVQLAEV